MGSIGPDNPRSSHRILSSLDVSDVENFGLGTTSLKGSKGHTRVIMLPRGEIGGLRRAILQGW
jgi:hypothetical protein